MGIQKWFLSFLVLLLSQICFGQNSRPIENSKIKDSILLTQYLESLEAKYQVFFTYSSNLISNEKVAVKTTEPSSLIEIIQLLENETGFDFEDLGNSYYVIYPKQNELTRLKKLAQVSIINLADANVKQTISGRIFDNDQIPLVGASVIIKGSNFGTTTDFYGNFTLEVNFESTLVASYIGYKTKEIKIDRSYFELTLEPGFELTEAIIIGSRNPNRTSIDTAVPVDVIDVTELSNSGSHISVSQILNYAAPSFSSNTQAISDGTDHIDPAQLRGLGPDQVLVLINGKRRHTSSLVNVNGTPGRGSVGTDLNTIPVAAIQRIEVLRDGASAQYGSDAIAGVINIVLKNSINEFTVALTDGANLSKNANDHNGGIDGNTFQLDLNYGQPLGTQGGFVNVAASVTKRQRTSRVKDRTDQIFHAYNAIEWEGNSQGYNLTELKNDLPAIQSFANQIPYFSNEVKNSISEASSIEALQSILNFDVTEQELTRRNLSRKDFNMSVGQSGITQGQIMGNLEFPIGNQGIKFYAFGGTSYRNGNASGFYRTPGHPSGRGNTLAYLNGFLPNIESDIIDNSLAIGISGKINNWDADVSHTFGNNVFKYNITNTTNFYLQSNSPTEFYAGLNGFKQNTVNLDLKRKFDHIFKGLHFAVGAEYRIDNFYIEAGEEASYAKYDINGNVISSLNDANNSEQVTNFFGRQPSAGAQVFSGFTPQNAVNAKRNSFAFYSDIDADVTKNAYLSFALRYEDFSDFGNSINFKIASRIKVGDYFNIRAAASTGFRAPSLHQQHYNKSNTLFNDDGIAYEVGSFTNSSQIAKLFGIPKLKEETSFNASLGFVTKLPELNLNLSVDAYLIHINDRITYTGDFTSFSTPNNDAQNTINNIFSELNIGRAAFFANAINTKTQGLDVVISHNAKLGKEIRLSNTFTATFSKTIKTGPIQSSPLLDDAGLTTTYFDESARIYLERALPRVKSNLNHNFIYKRFDVFLRNSYFGNVEDTGALKDNSGNPLADANGREVHPQIGAKVITDFSTSYKLNRAFKLTLGANNILDIYPDELPSYLTASNQFIYSRRISQFGYNGRFIFGRLNFSIR